MALSSQYLATQIAAVADFISAGMGAEDLVLVRPNGQRQVWPAQVSEGADDVYASEDGQIGTAPRVVARRPLIATGKASTAGAIEERRTVIERADGRRWTVTRVLRAEGELLSLYAV